MEVLFFLYMLWGHFVQLFDIFSLKIWSLHFQRECRKVNSSNKNACCSHFMSVVLFEIYLQRNDHFCLFVLHASVIHLSFTKFRNILLQPATSGQRWCLSIKFPLHHIQYIKTKYTAVLFCVKNVPTHRTNKTDTKSAIIQKHFKKLLCFPSIGEKVMTYVQFGHSLKDFHM